MPDSSPVIDSALLQQGAQLSAETVLAIRKYNQEVASYTLRQWNLAKLESERKERDRRKRRADALAQRAAGSPSSTMAVGTSPSSTATPSVGSGKVGHGLGSARTGSRPPPSDRLYHHHHHHHHGPPDSDGPLMMVSRRKTDRALSGHTSTALPFGQRHSHDGRYPPNNQLHHHKPYPSSQLHEDLAVMEQQQQQPPTHHHASVRVPLSPLSRFN
ncbi:hypothetical protein CPB86DRAFT_609110 [Serendipita vermifera]|nr:hypothetical protein CPB86DRAFT_609110 [Serendipita vermifera]